MLSKKAKYAIKALLALAEHEGEEPVRIVDLAREQQIPAKFLELILLDLRNQGILQSRKGKGGGYLLARDPRDIYLGQLGPLPAGSSSLEAVVRHVRAFGPVVRVELDLVGGGNTVEVHLSRDRFDPATMVKGCRVFVSPTNARVFARPA